MNNAYAADVSWKPMRAIGVLHCTYTVHCFRVVHVLRVIRVARKVRDELVRKELSEDGRGNECSLCYSRPVRTTRDALKACHEQ